MHLGWRTIVFPSCSRCSNRVCRPVSSPPSTETAGPPLLAGPRIDRRVASPAPEFVPYAAEDGDAPAAVVPAGGASGVAVASRRNIPAGDTDPAAVPSNCADRGGTSTGGSSGIAADAAAPPMRHRPRLDRRRRRHRRMGTAPASADDDRR